MPVFAVDITVARDGRAFTLVNPFGYVSRPAVATLAGRIVARGPRFPYSDTGGSSGNAALWIR
jgi:hypothetical protein